VGQERIVVLGTGGTIAGTAASLGAHLGYRPGQVPVADLVAAIPGLSGVRVDTEQVAQIDSKDMDPDVWIALAQRCQHWLSSADVGGLVVTHGTDTVEETAYFLHRVVAPAKPIVLACAMRPATALSPDGPQNLADAIAVVRSPGARGVVVACAGRVHAASDVRKVHPYRLDAFSSGDAGVLGYVEDGRLRRVRDWPQTEAAALTLGQLRDPANWPRVEIVLSHAGASARGVQALLRDGVEGIVVAGTGNGSVHAALEDALADAARAGTRVVRSTRCAEGHVIAQANDRLPSASLTPVQARIELLLQLLAQ
jgi:L-asparaginase